MNEVIISSYFTGELAIMVKCCKCKYLLLTRIKVVDCLPHKQHKYVTQVILESIFNIHTKTYKLTNKNIEKFSDYNASKFT